MFNTDNCFVQIVCSTLNGICDPEQGIVYEILSGFETLTPNLGKIERLNEGKTLRKLLAGIGAPKRKILGNQGSEEEACLWCESMRLGKAN